MTDDHPTHAGRRLLTGALLLVGSLLLAMATWTVVKALQHPDVRTRRPRWLDQAVGFDVSFWIPLLLTVVVGGGLVAYVLVRALRRLQAGEDLYATRFGRGVRRRGERRLQDDDADSG